MPTSVGPLFAAGVTEISKAGQKITFLPDAHNDELQRAGMAPIFYWMPNTVQLAKKDNGDFKFGMLNFAGVRSSDTNIGAASTDDEVAGGLLTFSTTTSPPADILRQAQADMLAQWQGSDDRYWGVRGRAAPVFRFFPIVSNTTSIANISPTSDGQVPQPATPAGAAGGAPGAAANGAPPPGRQILLPGAAPLIRAMPSFMPRTRQPRTAPALYRGSNLDPMFVRMSGQGQGSINPDADNAYSAMMGSLASCIVWNAFHMGTGPIVAYQNMMVRMISPLMTIDIEGDWSRIQDHFSAAAHLGGVFWSADVKVQFDSLRESGDIKVNTFIDSSLPGADKLQEYMDKRTDLVFQKFMDLAKTVIFDPAPFTEQPADASNGFLGMFGGGGALKLRRQQTNLKLSYHETKEMAYLQSYPVSGSLDGLADAIKSNPDAEKKYFRQVDVGNWDVKCARIFKPVVNWPDKAAKWVGEPVSFLSVQVGYPNAQGSVQWDGHVFGPNDGPDAQWNTATARKELDEVTNPPAGWTPDKTFIKRQIHFQEPDNALANPFARVQIETDLVDLDPGDLGSLSDLITQEIRVEETGTLAVGPVILGAMLDAPSQTVEVTLRAKGQRLDGKPRDPVKMSWLMGDQDAPRNWMVYTGQKDFVPAYEYQVRVVVKGSLFTKGMEWTGPWVDAAASGPLTVSVPTPDDPGVVKKALPPFAAAAAPAAPVQPPTAGGPGKPPSTGGLGKPPATRAKDAPPVGATAAARSTPPPRRLSEMYGWNMTEAAPTAQRDGPPGEEKVTFSGFVPAS